MQQENEGESHLGSLVGAHACVLDTSCQFFFCNNLGQHINSILINVDLSYFEQLFFNNLPDLMISHTYVFCPYIMHNVLA